MLINKKQCREFLLNLSQTTRRGKFTRVADDVYPFLEDALRREMRAFVRSHPTLGKTLSTGMKDIE